MQKKIKKIGYLGAGTWGTSLAALLANKGYDVSVWDRNGELMKILNEKRFHPKLAGFSLPPNINYVENLQDVFNSADMLIESVTSSGIRFVFEEIKKANIKDIPIVITSKGMEKDTSLLFPEIAIEILGEEQGKRNVGCISGPSHAEEVIHSLPTSLVCSSYNQETMKIIQNTFNTPNFRIYPNSDVIGVSLGGALKNIIAIACGISDGLGFGDNTKAALITRGLHEMRKLAVTKGGFAETMYGLSGMGDLCVTCLSALSRNYRFGHLIAEGYNVDEAKAKIGMMVEGAYTAISAWQLGKKCSVPLPITEATYGILYKGLAPREAVSLLLQRSIKEEHL